jgi:translation initiation factor 2 beta subunit (eIF-2beta)/eIF-5
MGEAIDLKEFNAVGVCGHMRRTRFLFRDERFEFLRCEGCGEILRLPLQPAASL